MSIWNYKASEKVHLVSLTFKSRYNIRVWQISHFSYWELCLAKRQEIYGLKNSCIGYKTYQINSLLNLIASFVCWVDTYNIHHCLRSFIDENSLSFWRNNETRRCFKDDDIWTKNSVLMLRWTFMKSYLQKLALLFEVILRSPRRQTFLPFLV